MYDILVYLSGLRVGVEDFDIRLGGRCGSPLAEMLSNAKGICLVKAELLAACDAPELGHQQNNRRFRSGAHAISALLKLDFRRAEIAWAPVLYFLLFC